MRRMLSQAWDTQSRDFQTDGIRVISMLTSLHRLGIISLSCLTHEVCRPSVFASASSPIRRRTSACGARSILCPKWIQLWRGGPVMSKDAFLRARTDARLKEKVEGIFAQLGLNTSDAINLFFHQVEIHGGLPLKCEFRMPRRCKHCRTSKRNMMWKRAPSLNLKTSRYLML